MNWIFGGTALVLLDWDVTVGSATVELLPDFIGLHLMRRGMEHLAGKDRAFDRGRHFAFGLELATAVLFGARLVFSDTHAKAGLWAMSLLLRLCFLALLYVTMQGAMRLKRDRGGAPAEPVKWLYPVITVVQPICLLLQWVPLLGTVCRIVSFILALCFLAAFRSCLLPERKTD